MKDIVILYHAECPDGFGASWAAHKKFGDDADYIGVHHNHPAPEGLDGREVYLLDFTYPEEALKDLISRNKRVTAIDHHVSAEEAVKMTKDYSFAINHSGSVLTWMYFFPDKPIPKLLEYIEDRDIFTFKLPDAHSICIFVDSLEREFSVWDKLAEDFNDGNNIKDFVVKGDIILKYEERLIEKIVEENAKPVQFEGIDTFVVNAPHEFADQICEILYKRKPPIAIVWSEDKERINVSLRSDGSADVSKLAAKFGGGGHKGSSGFNIPSINQFPWKSR